MTLEELCTRSVALWGIGSEGLAVLRLLAERGVDPLLIDDDVGAARSRLRAATGSGSGADHRLALPGEVHWGELDVVIRAPGVSRYRPELDRARAVGVLVTTAMAMWLEDFADARMVAVTGTKGKSTTAALAASILGHDGLDVSLLGNIGVPVTEAYTAPPVDAYVVEVSSFQAAEVTVSPGVCVLTSLAPDHLDWHGGREPYYRDKLRLIEAGPTGALAVNAGSDEAVQRTDGHPGRILYGPSGRVRLDPSGGLFVDDRMIGDTAGLRPPGRHNAYNLCGAVAGALLLHGKSPSAGAVQAALEGFEGLPSRCRTVGEWGGLTFVDDALASNPLATAASLEAFPDRELTVILGGADRGVDPAGLVAALALRRPRPRVVVLAPDPQHLARALAAGPDGDRIPGVEMASDLEHAVRMAAARTPAGGVVLFSPAAPTPPGEGGFSDRSRRFAAAGAGLTPSRSPTTVEGDKGASP